MNLAGIDGTHLLGFMAGIGTFALLDAHARERGSSPPRLSFTRDGTAIVEVGGQTPPQVVGAVFERLQILKAIYVRELAAVMNPRQFTAQSYAAFARAGGRERSDNLAGLAFHAGTDDEADESSLCAASGAGHQHLIQSMRDVLSLVEPTHIDVALFRPWTRSYEVPPEKRKELALGNRKPTLRLEPADERLYALRLTNPTTTNDFKTELGAQALAIPAFALLPVVPMKTPMCVSSRRVGSRIAFSWCLWDEPAALPTVRSLIYAGAQNDRSLRQRGAFAAFSVERIVVGKSYAFTPSVGLW